MEFMGFSEAMNDSEADLIQKVRTDLLSARLRVGELPQAERGRHYTTIVQGALGRIPAGRRKEFLTELSHLFPTVSSSGVQQKTRAEELSSEELVQALRKKAPSMNGTERAAVAGQLKEAGLAVEVVLQAPVKPPPELTPELLISKLIDLAQRLTVTQRLAYAQTLKDGGYSLERATTGQWTPPDSFYARFGLDRGTPLDETRFFELFQSLASRLNDIYNDAIGVWSAIQDPPAPALPAIDIGRLLGPTLDKRITPDNELATKQWQRQLSIELLVRAMISAVLNGGKNFARANHGRFNPAELRARAKGNEADAWRYFEGIARDYTMAELNKRVRQGNFEWIVGTPLYAMFRVIQGEPPPA